MSDVTAAIVFHSERLLAPASIASYSRCCEAATRRGIKITRLALLDRPDDITLECVNALGEAFDHIETVDNGDPGGTRNDAVSLSTSTYCVFFDGDDLWGEDWVVRAHQHAEALGDSDVVFHPRVIAMFSARDYWVQTQSQVPAPEARSHFLVQQDSRHPGFDPRSLFFCNLWSVNTFGLRSIYVRFPYPLADETRGFGIEDWTWNLQTLANGVDHAVVPDTVHCIRIKTGGSLGARHALEGLLPPIDKYAVRLEAAWEARSVATARDNNP